MLPHDLPPWQTVYGYYNNWRKAGIWGKMNDTLRRAIREKEGRESEPSAPILDSQTVKATAIKGIRCYDGGKKMKGRKRHILVDTLGLLLVVLIHSAGISEKTDGKMLWVCSF